MINVFLICLFFITTVISEVWLWFQPGYESIISFLVSVSALISFCHSHYNLKTNRNKYLKNIIETFKYDGQLVELKIVNYNSTDDDLGEIKCYRVREIISESKNVQIFGKPGSGKTSMLKMLMYELSYDAIKSKSASIPIYLEFGKNDLFEKIKNEFHSKGFVTDASKFSIDNIKNLLSRGGFTFLIDDVHKLGYYTTKEQTRIEELLSYSKNLFVLTSRDYFKKNEFGFELFNMAKLSHGEVDKIFELYLDRSEVDGVNRGILIHQGLSDLYNTPQMLALLSKVVKIFGRIPSNKAELFRQFLLMRNKIELGKDISLHDTRMNLKTYVLSELAFHMFQKIKSKYIIEIELCLEVLQNILKAAYEKGFEQTDAYKFIDYLFKEGYLTNYDGEVKFEHDQWQEYFAALYIHKNNISLKEFNEDYSIKEISYFVCGMFRMDKEDEKEKLNKYLCELLDFDFYLVGNSLKNFENRDTLDSVRKKHADFVVTDEFLRNAYEGYLNFYENILRFHFPLLKDKFHPETNGEIGIAIQRSKDKLGFWHGFFPISKEHKEKVVLFPGIFDEDRKRDPIEFRNLGIDLGLHVQFSDPTIYKLPIIGAFQEAANQLEQIIKSKKLIETDDLERESLFHELNALRKELFLTKKMDDITIQEFLDGFKKLKIEKEISHQYLHHNIVDTISLEKEVEKRFSENYEPVEIWPTTISGLYSHRITDLEVERKLLKFIKIERLGFDDKISPFFQLIPQSITYHSKVKYEQLSEEKKNNILEWYADFFEKKYRNYKAMIEVNFPTLKKYFRYYNNMPLLIVLLKSGHKHVYWNIEKQTECIKVQIMDEAKLAEFDKNMKFKKWLSGFWLGHIDEREEILRNDVYKLIEDEFKNFYKN